MALTPAQVENIESVLRNLESQGINPIVTERERVRSLINDDSALRSQLMDDPPGWTEEQVDTFVLEYIQACQARAAAAATAAANLLTS